MRKILWVLVTLGLLLEWLVKVVSCMILPLPWAARVIEHSLIALFVPFSLRRQVCKNLSAMFGDAFAMGGVRTVCRRYFSILFSGWLDLVLGLRITSTNGAQLILFEGKEHLDQALSRGKGVIAVTGHYSYLLRGLFVACSLGYKVHAIVRNPLGTRFPGAKVVLPTILKLLQQRTGVRWIFPGGGIGQARATLQQNEIVCFTLDVPRSYETEGGMRITFLNGEAVFPSSLIALAIETGASIVPCFVFPHWNAPWYVMKVWPPLVPERSDRDGVRWCLQTCAHLLASLIRRYPAHWWLWKDLHAFVRRSGIGNSSSTIDRPAGR